MVRCQNGTPKKKNKDESDFDETKFKEFLQRDHLRSDYLRTLKVWGSLFDERQIKVMFYDDLEKDPLGFLNEALSFLNIPATSCLFDPVIKNKGLKLPMPDNIRSLLIQKHKNSVRSLTAAFRGKKVNYPAIWLEKYKNWESGQ